MRTRTVLVILLLILVAATSSGATARRGASPTAQARRVRATWLTEVAKRAKQDPKARFHNLSRTVFFARLRQIETHYRVRVIEARLLHPRQYAPLVIVQAQHPNQFSQDVPAIQHILDPKRPTGDDRTGWAYEGFYLEARDAYGVPFLAIFNYWRGPHKGGGQWASKPSFYPYGTLGPAYHP